MISGMEHEEPEPSRKPRRKSPGVGTKVWGLIGALGILIGIGLVVFYSLRPPVPPAIKRQLSFPVLYASGPNFSADRKSFQYDGNLKILTFRIKLFSTAATVTEQATPSQFSDFPDLYGKLVEHLGQYDQFDSLNGQVTLTKPKDGHEAGVINTKGTLMFTRADADVSNDQWRQYYNQLVVAK